MQYFLRMLQEAALDLLNKSPTLQITVRIQKPWPSVY